MTENNEVEILLVEDNDNDAELTTRALRKNKLANNLVRVADGAEALDFLFCRGKHEGAGHTKPKVVLLDLHLPKIDGIEVLRQIRAEQCTTCLPVVVLTSSREERDIIETYKLRVNSYIVKPVDFDKFTEAVAAVGLYWLLLNHAPEK
jgi:CheY-like chemotaxis protein